VKIFDTFFIFPIFPTVVPKNHSDGKWTVLAISRSEDPSNLSIEVCSFCWTVLRKEWNEEIKIEVQLTEAAEAYLDRMEQ